MKQKISKYKDIKFNDISHFTEWLDENTKYFIELVDNGQDLVEVWVNSEGEILHTRVSGFYTYVGNFVNTDFLKIGENFIVYKFVGDEVLSYNTNLIIEGITTFKKKVKKNLDNYLLFCDLCTITKTKNNEVQIYQKFKPF